MDINVVHTYSGNLQEFALKIEKATFSFIPRATNKLKMYIRKSEPLNKIKTGTGS
jgi:hypothetical protein